MLRMEVSQQVSVVKMRRRCRQQVERFAIVVVGELLRSLPPPLEEPVAEVIAPVRLRVRRRVRATDLLQERLVMQAEQQSRLLEVVCSVHLRVRA